MKSYYRVMLGRKSVYASDCFNGNFIGADYDLHEDLAGKVPDQWRDFNKEYIPVFLGIHPEKSKIAAGLACGALWVISKGIKNGDIVLSPDGTGQYRVAEVIGDYYYVPDDVLPHRRSVRWLQEVIDRTEMSKGLRNSAGATGAVCNFSRSEQVAELETLIGGVAKRPIIDPDSTVEDPSQFVMEKHLEDFLIQNWSQTELGKQFDIYEEDGEPVGQQYQTDTGPLDILAISNDKNQLLVVELKKGRASDAVVGQILRYMGYVQDQLAEQGQTVAGVIIALEDDQRIRRALSMTRNIDFYRYEISFKLVKG